jgi:SAM-dependent methyltransferase
MLDVAHQRSGAIRCVQGDGRALPFTSGAFEYATCQFAYHHIGEPPALVAEVFRVLGRSGRFVLTNIDPWAMRRWSIYRYFPDAQAIDLRDYLPVETLLQAMADSGFVDIRVTRENHSREENARDVLAFAGRRHRASQLMAISDEAYQAGLRRLQDAVAACPNATARSEFVVVNITADKPT